MNETYKEISRYCKEQKVKIDDISSYMGITNKELRKRIETDPTEEYRTALKNTIDYINRNRKYL